MNSMSLEQYTSKLVGDIKDSIENDVKREAKIALREAINKTVYLEKKTYRPTYNLLNAVEVFDLKIGNRVATFRVGINASKLIHDKKTPWDWNPHGGISGQPFQEGLVEVLDQGTKSPNPIYSHTPNYFFDEGHKIMEEQLIVSMAESLRAKGWSVEIR